MKQCLLQLSISLVLLLQSWSGLTQTIFPKTSIAGNYQLITHAQINHRLIETDSSFLINLSINIHSDKDFEEIYTLKYEIKTSYTDENSLVTRTINYPVHGIGRYADMVYFRFDIPKDKKNELIILKLRNNENGLIQYYDLRIQGEGIYPPVDFYLLTLKDSVPITRHYVFENDSLYFLSNKDKIRDLYVYQYADEFPPADPPMKKLNTNVSKSLVIDSLFTVAAGKPFSLKKSGLYFIQSDTASLNGIGIRVEPAAFPSFAQFDDIIKPLIYISTNDEINKIEEAENKRKAFEEYWLNIAKSEENAGRLIKYYFDRIEEANQLFTGYKPGWKTDMGIIYIIYGPPDEAYRNGETEVWHYNRVGTPQPKITFNFLYLKNIFCQNHYMLIRDSNYREDWFRSVDQWRMGNL